MLDALLFYLIPTSACPEIKSRDPSVEERLFTSVSDVFILKIEERLMNMKNIFRSMFGLLSLNVACYSLSTICVHYPIIIIAVKSQNGKTKTMKNEELPSYC